MPLRGTRVLELGERIGVGLLGGLLAHFGATVLVPYPASLPRRHKWRNPAAVMFRKARVAASDVPGELRRADVILAATDIAALPGWSRSHGQILCDITAHAPGSPRAGMADSDAMVQALSGIAAATGGPNRPPVIAAYPMLEGLAALHGAVGVLTAYRMRMRGGRGQDVGVALHDCAVAAEGWPPPYDAVGMQGDPRIGGRHRPGIPWNSYRAADRDLVICTNTDAQFRHLATAMEAPGLAMDPRFVTAEARRAHAAVVDNMVADWAHNRPAAMILERLIQAGVPTAAIATHADVLADHNLAVRGTIAQATDPGTTGTLPVANCPIHFLPRRMPGPPITSAPPPMPAGEKPLQGVHVVEVGQYIPASLAGSYLAALGAIVTRIEPPSGDATRGWPQGPEGQGHMRNPFGAEKHRRAFNLQRPDGQRGLRRLLVNTDVLLDNLRPGTLARHGLDNYAIAQASPGILNCAISGYGTLSAYPERPAFDLTIQASSGIMDRTRGDGTRYAAGIPVLGIAGGLAATVAVLAGLLHPGGAEIDISLHDIGPWLTHWVWNEPVYAPVIRATSRGYELLEAGHTTPICTAAGHGSPTGAFPVRLSVTPLQADPVAAEVP